MAINQEIWVKELVDNFWPDNSFVMRSTDHSAYVNGKKVHVPNAAGASGVTKNRSSYPASVSKRADTDLEYSLDIYEVDPMVVRDLEAVELSYDLRSSVMANNKMQLQNAVIEGILRAWVPSGVTAVATDGATEAAHIPTATGNRKGMTKATVLAVKKQMDKDDVPAEGRCMLLDAVMYNQLLGTMTDAEVVNFVAGADVASGVIGRYMGFDIYMRSKVLKTTNTGAIKEWSASAAATDSAAGLAWQTGCVSRAMGEVSAYESLKDATYYGDVLSFGMRAGGASVRNDKKGVILIYQGTAA